MVPETGTLTEKDREKPQITLANGAVVEARPAVAAWERLGTLLATAPDEFRSLLALAEGRGSDADPQHFESLWASYLLENDVRTIRPVVRDVLLNSYVVTEEGPIVAPLRLQSAGDLPGAEWAQRTIDQLRRDVLFGRKDNGPLRD